MARVNVDILGLSELKWTGMGEFNSDDHQINYCGQESLSRNGVAIIVHKRVQNAVLECSLKNDNDHNLFPRQTIQRHSNPRLCFSTDAKEVEHSMKTYNIFWNEYQKKMSFSSKEIRMQK